jgi:hypothetical protein
MFSENEIVFVDEIRDRLNTGQSPLVNGLNNFTHLHTKGLAL